MVAAIAKSWLPADARWQARSWYSSGSPLTSIVLLAPCRRNWRRIVRSSMSSREQVTLRDLLWVFVICGVLLFLVSGVLTPASAAPMKYQKAPDKDPPEGQADEWPSMAAAAPTAGHAGSGWQGTPPLCAVGRSICVRPTTSQSCRAGVSLPSPIEVTVGNPMDLEA
jgi:hypothetical protein